METSHFGGNIKIFHATTRPDRVLFVKMSHNLDLIQIDKFKNSVSISKQCASSEDVIFIAHIGYDCLRCLHEAKQEQEPRCSYIKLLNILLSEKYCVKIRGDCSRLEGRLRHACGEVKNKFKGNSGASHRNLVQSELNLAVKRKEVVTTAELVTQIRKAEGKSNALLKENEVLKARCEELFSKWMECKAKKEEAAEDLAEANATVDSLFAENGKLYSYVDFGNNGKTLNEVGERQQRRKLKELKTNVERALWFAETFGLTLNSVTFSEKDGSNHTLSYKKSKKSPLTISQKRSRIK